MKISEESLAAARAFLDKAHVCAFWFLVIAAIVSIIFVGIATLYPKTALALVAFKVVGPF